MTKFRYDINALRAIAVISVLFYHLNVPYFSGGFAGVDVFFVISGYLMTKIIFDGVDKNEFSILNFWDRRIKRIVPALLFLIIVVTIVGFFFYLPDEYSYNERNASASLLFYSNDLYRRLSGYFDSAAENNIFLHTWSLSVEWQFYIIYPLIIWCLVKLVKKRQNVAISLMMTTFLLCCLSIFLTPIYPTASFYLLPARTWELLIGGCALFIEKKLVFRNTILLTSLYLVILLSSVFLSDKLLWPGIFTLFPVLATFGIIVLNQNDQAILGNNTVQFIGKISYSLYLWHWPLKVFAQYMGFQLNATVIIGIIALSVLFAYISYRFIESIKLKSSIPIISILAALAIFTNVLGAFDTNKVMFSKKTLILTNYAQNDTGKTRQFSTGCCFVISIDKSGADLKKFKQKACLKIDTAKKNILLLGDSHAACLSLALREQFKSRNINFLQATASYSFPFLKENGTNVFCHQLYQYIFYEFLVKNKKHIDGVILGGNWREEPKDVVKPLLQVADYLRGLGIPVVIIGQTNGYSIPFPAIVAKGLENNTDLTHVYSDRKADTLNDFLKEKLKPYYIDIHYKKEVPKLSPKLDPYMTDRDHLSRYGADLAAKKIFADPVFINHFRKLNLTDASR